MSRPAAPTIALLLAAVVVVAAGCAGVPPAEEEWDRELPDGVQLVCQDRDDGVAGVILPVRVVDDATGDPVPGARIDNWGETDWPHVAPWAELLAWSVTTDRDGWALAPALDTAPWYFVHAPGYAPLGEMAKQDEYRIVRGADVTLEVRDWQDRPVPGAVVEAFLGCGHTPTIRTATAGPDGRLVLRCIDPSFRTDLWVLTPGLAGRNGAYWGHGPGGFPEEGGVRILRGDPGPVVEGRVLHADGSPAVGAPVGAQSAKRGPWTLTGPDGRFRLVGAQPYDTIIARAPFVDPVPEGFEPPKVSFQSVPGVFATVRLPGEGQRTPTDEEREERRQRVRAAAEAYRRGEPPEPAVPEAGPGIRVLVTAGPGGVPRGGVDILAVREDDGAASLERPLFRDGVASRAIVLGEGTWTVTAGDRAGLLQPESRQVVVGRGWTDVSFTLGTNPTWKPRVLERSADGSGTVPVDLALDPDLGLDLDEDVDVDTDRGRFFITTEDGEVEATWRIDGRGAEGGSIHVPAAGPFAVEFRTADARSARVLLAGPPEGAGPTLVLPPPVPEREWPDPETRPREFPAARLRVLLPDGRPAAGAIPWVLSARPEPDDAYGIPRGETWSIELDDQGATTCAFDRGDRVSVNLEEEEDWEGLLPLRARIDGPGPWTLRWPDTLVTIRAVDVTGAPVPDFAVLTTGWYGLDPVDGVVGLRGASGPLRFWVGADGHRPHDIRLFVSPGARRDVTVLLRPMSAAAD